MANQIFVERETFEKNGRTFFSYFIKGNIRGKEVKVAVVPPDKGGYTVLDIVFGDAMAAELKLKPYEIKDESTGKVISGNTYAVQTVTRTEKSTSAVSSRTATRTKHFSTCSSKRRHNKNRCGLGECFQAAANLISGGLHEL